MIIQDDFIRCCVEICGRTCLDLVIKQQKVGDGDSFFFSSDKYFKIS